MDLKKLYEKYKDIIPYAVFGVLTTLVNIAAYWAAAHILKLSTVASTVAAWILAVLFAYLTNRKWVFHSTTHTGAEILKEITSFFAARLLTGLLDVGCMYLFVDVLKFNDFIIKAAANVLVIVLNYAASKLIIFKRQ